jgi:hypothetical protein
MLNKEIKKALKEAKEKKENLLIKEDIVQKRILMIFENENNIKNFKKLPESKKVKIGFSLVNEITYLKESNLMSEADLGSLLKGLFGRFLKSAPETLIFEPMFNSILNAIGIPDGLFRKSLVSLLATNPSEFIAALSDCKKLTTLIAKSISEGLVMQLQQTKGFGGLGYGIIRNALGDALNHTEFIQKIEDGLGDTVCNLLGKFTSNAQNVTNKLSPSGS